MAIAHRDLEASIIEQCSALRKLAEQRGLSIDHAKPHGALYHDANASRPLADVVISGVMSALGAVAMIKPPSGALREAAVFHGIVFLGEGFADRGTRADGSLIPRRVAGPPVVEVDRLDESSASSSLSSTRRISIGNFAVICTPAATFREGSRARTRKGLVMPT